MTLAKFPKSVLPGILYALLILPLASKINAEEAPAKISSMLYHPLLYTDEKNGFTGTVGETVKALCRTGGLNCDFMHLPMKRSLLMLSQDRLDATITIDTGIPRDCCNRTEWGTPWSAGFYSHLPPEQVPMVDTDLLGLGLIVINGMRSPYMFAPKLDTWEANNALSVTHATSINNAIRMFLSGRSDLLWGSDDFDAHFKKHGNGDVPAFHPRATYPIVVWVSKDRPDLLLALNQGYEHLQQQHRLNEKNLIPATSRQAN